MTDSNEDLVLGEWEVGRLGGWEIQITPARSTTTTPRRQARRFSPIDSRPRGPYRPPPASRVAVAAHGRRAALVPSVAEPGMGYPDTFCGVGRPVRPIARPSHIRTRSLP